MPKLPQTSLIAQGHEDPPPDSLSEVGSSQGSKVPDLVPKLNTLSQASRVYEEMTNGDVATDVSLRGAKTSILAAQFFLEAIDGEQENQDIKDFVEYNLFTGMEKGFLTFLENCLRMFEHGFSISELVWENRQWAPQRSMANRKTYTMLKKIAHRPATTISNIEYDDNGEVAKITQTAIGAKMKTREVDLPLTKTVWFTFNQKNGRIEGKSLLRTAYEPWYYKTHLYKIDAIQKERHGIGVPKIPLPPQATEDDKKAAHELGKNLRTNEAAYIIEPFGWGEIGFAELKTQPVDVLPSIEHHNAQIFLNVMMQFLLLGVEGSGGGRATSAAQVDMYQKSLKYITGYICEVFNLYIIPKLVSYNFDTDRFPKLQVRNIGETKDIQALSAAYSNLANQELITPDIDLEQWIRKQFDMPAKTEDRPEFSQANIRETLQGQLGASGQLTDPKAATPAPKPTLGQRLKNSIPKRTRTGYVGKQVGQP